MNRVRKAQKETQGLLMRCEVADESVVVMKSRPVKAGNSLEGKTGMTCRLVDGVRCEPKAAAGAKGGSLFEGFWNQLLNVEPDTSRPTGRDTLSAVGCKRPSAGNGRPSKVTGTGCRRLPFGIEGDGSPAKIGGETSRAGRRKRRIRYGEDLPQSLLPHAE